MSDPRIRFEFVKQCMYGQYDHYKDICEGEAVVNNGRGYDLCRPCYLFNLEAIRKYEESQNETQS